MHNKNIEGAFRMSFCGVLQYQAERYLNGLCVGLVGCQSHDALPSRPPVPGLPEAEKPRRSPRAASRGTQQASRFPAPGPCCTAGSDAPSTARLTPLGVKKPNPHPPVGDDPNWECGKQAGSCLMERSCRRGRAVPGHLEGAL